MLPSKSFADIHACFVALAGKSHHATHAGMLGFCLQISGDGIQDFDIGFFSQKVLIDSDLVVVDVVPSDFVVEVAVVAISPTTLVVDVEPVEVVEVVAGVVDVAGVFVVVVSDDVVFSTSTMGADKGVPFVVHTATPLT